MGIPVIDFIIISENDHYSFYEKLKKQKDSFDYVADGMQGTGALLQGRLVAGLACEFPVLQGHIIRDLHLF